jgi:hypothetical protein
MTTMSGSAGCWRYQSVPTNRRSRRGENTSFRERGALGGSGWACARLARGRENHRPKPVPLAVTKRLSGSTVRWKSSCQVLTAGSPHPAFGDSTWNRRQQGAGFNDDAVLELRVAHQRNLGAFVVALHLDNEMQRWLSFEPHDEIRNVVVRLAVVEGMESRNRVRRFLRTHQRHRLYR